jgi:hypothetical protein
MSRPPSPTFPPGNILAKLFIFNTVTEKLEAPEAMPTKIAPS